MEHRRLSFAASDDVVVFLACHSCHRLADEHNFVGDCLACRGANHRRQTRTCSRCLCHNCDVAVCKVVDGLVARVASPSSESDDSKLPDAHSVSMNDSDDISFATMETTRENTLLFLAGHDRFSIARGKLVKVSLKVRRHNGASIVACKATPLPARMHKKTGISTCHAMRLYHFDNRTPIRISVAFKVDRVASDTCTLRVRLCLRRNSTLLSRYHPSTGWV